jgi:hypothetical protein
MLSGDMDPAEVADAPPRGGLRPTRARMFGASRRSQPSHSIMTKESSTMGAARTRAERRLKDMRGAAAKPRSPRAPGKDVLAKVAMSWGLSLTCLACAVGHGSRRPDGG